jgi:ribosomal protein L13E
MNGDHFEDYNPTNNWKKIRIGKGFSFQEIAFNGLEF